MNAVVASPAAELPDRLRLATRELHIAAERSGLMATLLGGRIERDAYLRLLRNLHAVYAALEPALARQASAGSEHLAPAPGAWAFFAEPVLHRTAAIASDLVLLHGPAWPDELALTEAAATYAARLQRLASEGSPALVAHAYVRYLGDLHGGQVLKRRVALALGLPGDAGLAFYEFGPAEGLPALRTAFRTALGSLPLTGPEVDGVVEEARWGFAQHIRLFAELAVAPDEASHTPPN